MDSVTKKVKDIRTLSYRIEHEGVSTAELLEKTFCFACGCFQGGGGSGQGNQFLPFSQILKLKI